MGDKETGDSTLAAAADSAEGLEDFIRVRFPEPHRSRCLDILRRHPEVKSLFGRNPATAFYVGVMAALQLAIAFALRHSSIWLILPVAWCVGAFVSHVGFCLYHECSHQLVFKRRAHNHLLGIFANLPLFIPSYASFCVYHLKHHQYQGDYELDADMATRWEARLVGRSPVGKLFWQLFFPVFQCLRTLRFSRRNGISFFNGWVVLNWAAQFVFLALVAAAWGPRAILYLAASFFFSVGLHPLGARWVQEHFVIEGDQETYSYYGALNRVAVNIGYHNEHHDFPFVPWNRLPAVKALAPEVYDALASHRSWVRLWLRFLMDPRMSLFRRVARDARHNRARNALPRDAYAPHTFDETIEGAL
jgi:sphingolipid 4-desaturase/C4-monooxygenase